MSDIIVTLKDCVRGELALNVLSRRPLKGKGAHVISKAARKVKPLIEDYRKGIRGILEDYNAKPDEDGNLKLDVGDKNYKKARKEMETYDETELKAEITLTGLRLITLDEFLEAIPAQKNDKGEEIREAGIVEPFILEGLAWLLED